MKSLWRRIRSGDTRKAIGTDIIGIETAARIVRGTTAITTVVTHRDRESASPIGTEDHAMRMKTDIDINDLATRRITVTTATTLKNGGTDEKTEKAMLRR